MEKNTSNSTGYLDDAVTEAFLQTVADNKWEKIAMFLYGALILLGGTVANGLVLFLTSKIGDFYDAFMYIRAAYAVVDIGFIWGSIPVVLANRHFANIPTWMTCYFGDVGLGMFLSSVHLTALIALERYFFFCQPMKYHRFFNLKTIASTCTIMIVITQAYVFGTEIKHGRDFQPVILLCQLNDSFHNILQVVVYIIPSTVLVVFSIIKIGMMATNLANKVVMPASQDTMEPQLRREAAKKAVKLIFLVSGAFWGTCIPIYLVRTTILMMGYTWEQLNNYENPVASSMIRFSQFSAVLSTVLDPLIYFWVNPDLRMAFRKTFGMKEVYEGGV